MATAPCEKKLRWRSTMAVVMDSTMRSVAPAGAASASAGGRNAPRGLAAGAGRGTCRLARLRVMVARRLRVRGEAVAGQGGRPLPRACAVCRLTCEAKCIHFCAEPL